MQEPDLIIFKVLLAGLTLATFMVVGLLLALFYQVAIKPELQEWKENRKAKARGKLQVQSA